MPGDLEAGPHLTRTDVRLQEKTLIPQGFSPHKGSALQPRSGMPQAGLEDCLPGGQHHARGYATCRSRGPPSGRFRRSQGPPQPGPLTVVMR